MFDFSRSIHWNIFEYYFIRLIYILIYWFGCGPKMFLLSQTQIFSNKNCSIWDRKWKLTFNLTKFVRFVVSELWMIFGKLFYVKKHVKKHLEGLFDFWLGSRSWSKRFRSCFSILDQNVSSELKWMFKIKVLRLFSALTQREILIILTSVFRCGLWHSIFVEVTFSSRIWQLKHIYSLKD